MKKNIFLILLIAIPLSLIFLAFFNPTYGDQVRKSILIFTVFAIPYCLSVKDPRKGLLLFLFEASLLDGPWKNFTHGTNLKLLVYVIRDLLLYATFLNFLMHKKRILSENILRQKPPYTGLIFIFLLNVIIQIFNPDNFNYLSAIAGSRMFWEMMPLYWMGFYLMRDKNHFKVLCWAVLLCVFFNSGAAILQYNWGKERVALIAAGYYTMIYEWDRRLGSALIRPPGLGPDMGFAGSYFSQAIGFIIALFIIPQAKKRSRKLLSLILVTALTLIGFAGLIASTSRTSVVISGVYLVIIILLRKDLIRGRPLKIAVLSILLLFLVIPYTMGMFKVAAERYETIKTPRALFQTVMEKEKGRALQIFILPFRYSTGYFFGNGLGKVGPGAGLFSHGTVGPTNAENAINLSITEIGTIGTILWIALHIIIIRHGFRIYRGISDFEWKCYSMIPLSYMLLVLSAWQFGQLINFPANAAFWFMSGSLMGLRYIED